MQARMQMQTDIEAQEFETQPRWSLSTRIAFRFAFVYFALYTFPFPLDLLPYGETIARPYTALWHAVVPWVGKHILHLSYDISVFTNGSGDTTYDYVQVLCWLIVATATAVVWSVLDRKRIRYSKLYQWLRLFVRFWLASVLFSYGMAKVLPNQMPAPLLSTLLEPYGESSPMGLLWTFIGASKPFEIFTGLAEMLGGALLLIPRTTTLGALVSAGDMAMVFMLNMSYDVPVKLYSFHLLVTSVFLLAPDLERLGKLFLLGRQVELVKSPPLFARTRLNHGLLALQAVFGLYLLYTTLHSNYQGAKEYGFLAPKPPLYGIWNVDEFAVDGEVKPPLLTDESRWRRVIFERIPGLVAVQLVDGSRLRYRVQVDTDKKTLTLTKREDPNKQSEIAFVETQPGQMTLDGELDGHKLHVNVRQVDEPNFLLVNRGFHWIQEFPFNR